MNYDRSTENRVSKESEGELENLITVSLDWRSIKTSEQIRKNGEEKRKKERDRGRQIIKKENLTVHFISLDPQKRKNDAGCVG